jgi:hypothetical protein
LTSGIHLARTPVDYYEQTRRRKQPVTAPSPDMERRYHGWIEELQFLIPRERVDWQLDGGLAVAAHLGGFRRQHSDADVGVFASDLRDLETCLAGHRFHLFSRNPLHLMEYTPIDLVRRTSSDAILSGRRTKRLTAIKVDRSGRPVWDRFSLTRFDVHVHHPGPDVVRFTDDAIPLPIDLFFGTRATVTFDGARVTLASVPFLYAAKLRTGGNRPRHRFDLECLERLGLISAPQCERVRGILDAHYTGARWAGERAGLQAARRAARAGARSAARAAHAAPGPALLPAAQENSRPLSG